MITMVSLTPFLTLW